MAEKIAALLFAEGSNADVRRVWFVCLGMTFREWEEPVWQDAAEFAAQLLGAIDRRWNKNG